MPDAEELNALNREAVLHATISPKAIAVRRSIADEAPLMAHLSAKEIGGDTASADTIRRMIEFNNECFFTILKMVEDTQRFVGFYANLLLNQAGTTAAQRGEFDGLEPDISLLCPPWDQPAALYGWGMVAKGGLHKIAGPEMARLLRDPRYCDLDVYARAGTAAGMRSALKSGAVPLGDSEPRVGGLFVLRRSGGGA